VIVSDIAPGMVEVAGRRNRALANVETAVVDGEQLNVDDGSFDAVISRVGFIYFPDQQRALQGMRRALRPGGKLAGIVYSTAQANPFFSIPVSIIRRRAGLPPPAPGQPGPFSLGDPGVIEAAYERAGFTDIETRRMAAPLRLASTAECLRFEQESFGALHQMLAGLSEQERTDAWTEIEAQLDQFQGPHGFEGPCELLIAAGTR
jgi:SAM-dependent methyltransferase